MTGVHVLASTCLSGQRRWAVVRSASKALQRVKHLQLVICRQHSTGAHPSVHRKHSACCDAGVPCKAQHAQHESSAPLSQNAVCDVDGVATEGSAAQQLIRTMLASKRFKCTQCGKCCTGNGEVWVSENEIARMSQHLHMPRDRFIARYMKSYRKKPGWFLLKNTRGTQDCVFLDDNNQCSVHAVRPLQCATYPWWPELVFDAKSWAEEREHVCEGLDHDEADALDVADATRQLQAFMKHSVALNQASNKKPKD